MSFIKRAAGALTGTTARRRIARAGTQYRRELIGAGRRQALAATRGLGIQAAGVRRARAIMEREQPAVFRGYERAITGLEPYAMAGRRMMPALQAAAMRGPVTEAELMATPGVQFRLREAQRAFERGAAARGRLLGGAAQRELARYMQELAATEYGAEEERRLARLREMRAAAGLGLQAAVPQAELVRGLAAERGRWGMTQAGLAQELARVGAAQVMAPADIMAQARLGGAQARMTGRITGAEAQQRAMGGLLRAGGAIGGTVLGGPIGGAIAGQMMGGVTPPALPAPGGAGAGQMWTIPSPVG